MKRRTPYFHKLEALGARFQDRLGFATINFVTSVAEEHLAVRSRVGVFDVASQVAIEVRGRDAESLLAEALVNDVRRLPEGGAFYSPICNVHGGVIDDLTCFKFSSQRLWLSPSPARVQNVISALDDIVGQRSVSITNLGFANGYLSIQGPRSRDLLGKLTSIDLSTSALPYFSFRQGSVADVPDTVVSRTGYSGELGYELFYPGEYAEHVWDQVFAAGSQFGVVACGMKAMRSLRIEKMYVLNGLDLTEENDPIAAGLGWTVRFNDREFIGKSALQQIKAGGAPKRLCLLQAPSLDVSVSSGDIVYLDDEAVGTVTSADPGFTLGSVFAFAYLPIALAHDDVTVRIASRSGGSPVVAKVMTKAPYDPERQKLRS